MRWQISVITLCLLLLAADGTPRQPRVLFFHASWCNPCHAALDDDKENSFPKWLRASGWTVGVSIRDHVQLVDIDQRHDLQELYGVTTIPAMVLVDGKKNSPIPYTGRQSLVDLFKPKAEYVPVVGQHSHVCSRCRTEWWHGAEAANNIRAHNCPKCGAFQYVVSQQR